MLELKGEYNDAKVFTENIDEGTLSQIVAICNEEFTKDLKIRIMPDTHVGKGSVIGTTMTIEDKVVPNLVGVDVGCGMSVAKLDLKTENLDFSQLDKVIRTHVPSGFNIRNKLHPFYKEVDWGGIITPIDFNRAKRSIGTLGGGNHFIEVNQGKDDSIYLVIHSGSRNLGKQVAENYQKQAFEELSLKYSKVNKNLAYLEGQSFNDYINDMNIAQKYASLNRKAMISEIVKHMDWGIIEQWESIHNFIDTEKMILRKGATSAQSGEKLLIPINMRDGSIIAIGKGNPDWNYSAPHGAGRLMSRSKAKNTVKLEDFKKTMKDVWTTSVQQSTIDESPFAYKSMEEIISNISDTVDITDIIKPLYNFKA